MDIKLLLRIMKAKGVTQDKLAKTLNITRQGFWKKINGYSEFKLSEINKISEILSLTVEQRTAIFFTDYVDENAYKT